MSTSLYDFILVNRELITAQVKVRADARAPVGSSANFVCGIPIFLSQLLQALAAQATEGASSANSTQAITLSAGLHGNELLKCGFTLGQVVHGYGDVCQVVTSLAGEQHAPISVNDFHVFNRCLDDAIAGAVTAYGLQRERDLTQAGTARQGVLAHELRNLLHMATLSFEAMQNGTVGIAGSTGAVHARSLASLNALVGRALAEVRREASEPKIERLRVASFIEETKVSAALLADAQHIQFTVGPVDLGLVVDADRQLLGSALMNLVQNAFKFTKAAGNVSLLTRSTPQRVLIDVSDECGGLPEGRAEALFLPFTQVGSDRSGLGLGLTIALSAVRANSGLLSVRDMPGKGCVFTIDLPRAPAEALQNT